MRLDEIRREELRGLFILGLLAILWQFQPRLERMAESKSQFWSTVSVFNYLLAFFWGAYAIFMILGWSQDFLSDSTCRVLRSVARGFLELSFGLVIMLSVIALIAEYGIYMLVAFAITVAVILIRFVPVQRLGWPRWVSLRKRIKGFLRSLATVSVILEIVWLYAVAFTPAETYAPDLPIKVLVASVAALGLAWLVYRPLLQNDH